MSVNIHIKDTFSSIHYAIKENCTFSYPYADVYLQFVSKRHRITLNHWSQNWSDFCLQLTHPSLVAVFAHVSNDDFWKRLSPSANKSSFSLAYCFKFHIFTWPLLHQPQQPLWPDMFFRVDASSTKDANFSHGVLHREEEKAEDIERCGNPHSEAGRLLQESEESSLATNVPPSEEVTSQTGPVRLSGDCTATRTHSNNPEGAS